MILRSVLFAAAMAFSVVAADKPNIVFVLADDLGVFDLACYGRAEHRTPNLDRLASEGMRFTQAYCAQPICSPSRAALLTGKTPARLHLTTFLPGRADCTAQKLLHPNMRQELPTNELTLAERLKTKGYTTACIGKWHLGGKGFLPTDQGFDYYYAGEMNTKPSETEGGKGEQDLTSKAIDFISTNKSRPFFLYLPHNNPHIPYSARTNRVAANSRALEPVYAAVIEELDDSVGRLLSALDNLGLRENTIVIFTSDNGGLHMPEGGHKVVTHNGPYRAGKGYLYEGGIRIPLIVRWPGKLSGGVVNNTPVINTDWPATLAKADGTDGVDIFSKQKARRLFWHFPHYTNQGSRPAGAIRDGDWKFIEHYEDGSFELYNLASDVSETTNLAAQEPMRVAEMKQALNDWRIAVDAQTNALNASFNPAAHRRIYLDFDSSRYNAAQTTDRARVLEWRRDMDAAWRIKN